VLKQKEYGAEFIKIVNVNREAFFAIQETAVKVGLHVAGHLNPIVSATEASKAGMKAMEHLGPTLSILVDCSTAEEMIRQRITAPPSPAPSGPAGPPSLETIRRIVANPTMLSWSQPGLGLGLQFAISTYSEEKSRALAKVFAKNGTWQVPTLIRIRTMQISDDPVYGNDPNLRYVAPETRTMWAELTEAYKQIAPEATKTAYKHLYDQQVKLVKLLKEEGGKMLAGSDMTGIYCIPGFSLHQEFRELSKAGLSPLEILQMTTLNGAEFLNREATMGTVTEGKNADLVLLDANPIKNAENLERIHAVVLKGRYFPKGELERMKSEVEGFYAKDRN
jgi:imidazolonepropionase-like amidohydrolase